MDQGVDGAEGVGFEGQGGEQFGHQHRVVGQDGVVGQPQLGVLLLQLGDADVGYLAAGAAGGGHDDQALALDDGYLALEGVGYVLQASQGEQLGDVDDRAAAHGHHALVVRAAQVVHHALYHLVARLAGAVLLLHHKRAGQVQPADVRLVDEGLGDDQVALAELERLGEAGEGVELVYVAFYGEHGCQMFL